MNRTGILITLSVLSICFTRCEQNLNNTSDLSDSEQEVFFLYEYTNMAWGFQNYGWIIDSEGNINCFDKPERFFRGDSMGVITAAQMDSNLMYTDSACYKISKKELLEKASLIHEASLGNISDPENEMYDAGIAQYSAFKYNRIEKTYKKVILYQWGDWMLDNDAPAAHELHQWMDTLYYRMQIKEQEKIRDSFKSKGTITGLDFAMCPCCGSYFININDTVYRFWPDSSIEHSLNLSQRDLPINVYLDWELATNSCAPDLIDISRIKLACSVDQNANLNGKWHLISVSCECMPVNLEKGDCIWNFNTMIQKLTVQKHDSTDIIIELEPGTYEINVNYELSKITINDIEYDFWFEDCKLYIANHPEVDGPLIEFIRE